MLPTLPAFTPAEQRAAHLLLAAKVAQMMARTFEEGDWTEVYCAAKRIPCQDWSNLKLDVMYGGLGVEHKKLGRDSRRPITYWCGESLMHPAETRAIRVPPPTTDPDEAMRVVFRQYADNLEYKRSQVREQSGGGAEADMRTGLLLYQPGTLREFLYFEKPTVAPGPEEHYAIWKENPARGARRGSVNLWIFDRYTDRKRFSVTTEAGNKLQPYYDIPAPTDPNLYVFTVQGEDIGDGQIRIWITVQTARELRRVVGALDFAALSEAILNSRPGIVTGTLPGLAESVEPVVISTEAYNALIEKFVGVSDEHRMRLFVEHFLQS